MRNEKTDSAAGVRLDVGEAIRLARDYGYFREMLEDARSDPSAMQPIWVAAKGHVRTATRPSPRPDVAMVTCSRRSMSTTRITPDPLIVGTGFSWAS
jgi:hypothetical protein